MTGAAQLFEPPFTSFDSSLILGWWMLGHWPPGPHLRRRRGAEQPESERESQKLKGNSHRIPHDSR